MTTTPGTDWQEVIADDEAARFEAYGAVMETVQARRDRAGAAHRALHMKGLAGVEAEFVVRDDVPEAARIGIFAAPGAYRGYVRFSSGSPRLQPDPKADIRGMAVKLVGVPGKKLIPGLEDAKTFDFSMIQSPTIAFRNADEFMFFVTAASKPLTLLPRMIGRFGLGRTLGIVRGFGRAFPSVPSLAGLRFWTPVPIRFGRYAAKYGVRSAAPVAAASSRHRGARDSLCEELADRLADGPLAYDFGVQFYVDPRTTPIEDASVEWRESDTPFVPLATLTLPRQDVRAPRGRAVAAYVETLSFDPWHAPEEFRPLGDVMRARKVAYYASVRGRDAAPEPEAIKDL
jgi:catalase